MTGTVGAVDRRVALIVAVRTLIGHLLSLDEVSILSSQLGEQETDTYFFLVEIVSFLVSVLSPSKRGECFLGLRKVGLKRINNKHLNV